MTTGIPPRQPQQKENQHQVNAFTSQQSLNTKKRCLVSLIFYLFHCAPIFWKHPPKFHVELAIAKDHKNSKTRAWFTICPSSSHYSHKGNATCFPSILTYNKQTIPPPSPPPTHTHTRKLHQLPTFLSLLCLRLFFLPFIH